MSSQAKIDANRINAQKSAGPVTAAGKEVCSRNALKHALCGVTVLLPNDDLDAYHDLVALINDKYRPETDPERLLIQQIADIEWRLLRIPQLEAAIFFNGRRKADQEKLYEDVTDLKQRQLLIDGDTQCEKSKALSNLTLNQNRLHRQLEKRTAEFEKLRHEREIVQTAHRDQALLSIMGKDTKPLPSVGSEFSWDYLVARGTFKHYAPEHDLAHFDRTWRDKSAKTPD